MPEALVGPVDLEDAIEIVRRRPSGLRRLLRSRVTALIAFLAVYSAVVTATDPEFMTVETWQVIFENMALESIAAAATVMLSAAGRFDLSIDGIAALSGILAGKLMLGAGFPGLAAALVGLAFGLGVGLLNGVLIELLDLNPLVTTLATWWIAAGAALGLTGGIAPYGFPQSFLDLGQATVGPVLILIVYALVIVPILAIVLRFTTFGYHVYAVGGDREAARLNGIPARRVGVLLYGLSGIAAAFVGVFFAARLGTATPDAVNGLALNVIAAAIIGGASLNGGRGSVIGAFLGILLLNVMIVGSFYLGVPAFWVRTISGVVLFAAVLADAISRISRTRSALEQSQGLRGWLLASRRSVPVLLRRR
jgi:ribose transport system permease protein